MMMFTPTRVETSQRVCERIVTSVRKQWSVVQLTSVFSNESMTFRSYHNIEFVNLSNGKPNVIFSLHSIQSTSPLPTDRVASGSGDDVLLPLVLESSLPPLLASLPVTV